MYTKLKTVFREDSPFKLFFAAMLMMGLGYGIYKGMIDNYFAEIVGIGEFERGVTEFFRELPGLLLVFILAALYMCSAEKIYKIGAVIMLGGMVMLCIVPPVKVLVIVAVCVYSLGEHIQLGMKTTLTLEYSQKGKEGQALGYQNGINQIGTVAGYAVVIIFFLILSEVQPFKPFFIVAACIMGLATLLSFRLKGKSETDKTNQKFYFNKKYTKYYFLEVFYGARKQVFFTFGPYVLILIYGADAMVISLLFAISAILSFFLAPVVGRIIDRFGYKIVMVSDTLILVVVCFFYGFANRIFPENVAFIVCCVNYILDSVISLASMASNVYVQDLSDSKEETKLTINTGISINHLITIFIALFGGWIWQELGVEVLFMVSAGLGLLNSAFAATIKTGKQLKKKTNLKE